MRNATKSKEVRKIPVTPNRIYYYCLIPVMGELFAVGQPTRPTQPSIPSGLVNE